MTLFSKMSNNKKNSIKRSEKSRNLSEKKRRDQFNLLVNELSSMVSTGGRKMDKSTVLKSTISFLKNHNEITVRSRAHEIQEDWKPTFLTNEEFTHLVLEAVDGFIIVFSTSGQIFYVSESVSSLLGQLPNDFINTTFYEMVCEEEQNELYNKLLTPSEVEQQLSFSCHLRRGGPDFKYSPSYELIHFVGYFRSDGDNVQTDSSKFSGYSGETDTRLVFVGTGRLQTPQLIREIPLIDSSKIEFISRHSLEWKFLFLDHRAPPIIGYLPFELLGTSSYDYYHIDDLDKVVSCHEALMLKGEGTSCNYRFLTKGQQWIWLQSRFYITYHQWNSKPEFIVCTHRVVSYVEIIKQNRKEENLNILQDSSANSDNETCMAWTTKNTTTHLSHDPPSECSSMSADSSASKQPVVTQISVKSRASHGKHVNMPTQSTQKVQPQTTFMKPPQYVATIPVQTLIANFHPPNVLSPLPQVDNLAMTPAQTQLQADLQRKHAELQAIIGQQQAELRRVSEQLLMARLGFLPSTQAQSNINTSVSYNNTGVVSSTTTAVVGPPGSSVIVPVTVPITIPIGHNESNMIFSTPDEK